MVRSGLAASEPVEFGLPRRFNLLCIESAWQAILAAEPNHIIIHPIIIVPVQWPRKAQRAFWHFCAEISFLTNLPEGSLNRLESLDEGYDSEKTFDPRFALLQSQCLVGDNRSDQRQAHLFEDICEAFDDGALCALRLRSERYSEALPVLPSAGEYSMLSNNNSKGMLPDSPQSLHSDL